MIRCLNAWKHHHRRWGIRRMLSTNDGKAKLFTQWTWDEVKTELDIVDVEVGDMFPQVDVPCIDIMTKDALYQWDYRSLRSKFPGTGEMNRIFYIDDLLHSCALNCG